MFTAKHFGPAIAGAVGNAAYQTYQDTDHTSVHGFKKTFMNKLKDPTTMATGAVAGTAGVHAAKTFGKHFFGGKEATYGDLEYYMDKLSFIGQVARMVGASAMASAKRDKSSVARNGYWSTVGDKMRNPKRWLASAVGLGSRDAYQGLHKGLLGGLANMNGTAGKVGKFFTEGMGRHIDPTSTTSTLSQALGFVGVKTPYKIVASTMSNPDSKLYSKLTGDFWEKGERKPYRSPVREDSF